MADSSRSRITITLGSSGQVVRRDISASTGPYSDSRMSGIKRSTTDRIGDDDGRFSWQGSQVSSSKRQRGDSMQSSSYSGYDDGKIRKDDLRLKLMRKSAYRQAQNDDSKKHVDLREKLSKPARSLVINPELRHRLPVPENMRETIRVFRQSPPSRSVENFTRVESRKSSCTPWPLDHVRRGPSDQFQSTSMAISSLRNVDDLPRRPLQGTYEDFRSVPYMNKDVPSTARPLSTLTPLGTASASVAPQSVRSSVAAKPVAAIYGDQLPPLPSSITVAPKSSYTGDGQPTPQTVDGLLQSLGLGKYVITFKAEEVDMTALKQMGENDLKELGIPMGPRKKILLALAPRNRRMSS